MTADNSPRPPSDWESVALGLLATERCDGPFGSSLTSNHYVDEGVRVIRLQNIGFAEFKEASAAFIGEDYARALAKHEVAPGDLLVAGLGDERNPVGRGCVAPQGLGPAIVKADCFRFRLNTHLVDPGFVAYQLSAEALGASGALATGATRARINLTTTSSRKVVFPSLPEQRAITSFLDRETAKIDRLIEQKERLIELLEEERTALITRAVTRGVDPDVEMKDSGVEWLGEIPAHWDTSQLQFLTQATRPIMYGIVLPGPNVSEGVPIVKGGDVKPGRLDRTQLNRTTFEIESKYVRSRLRGGDLVYAIRGSIGEVERVPDELTGANLTQDAARISVRDGVDADWLLYALRSSPVFAQLEAGSLGATIRGINIRDLKRVQLPVPPHSEQGRIAEFLRRTTRELVQICDDVSDAITLLREYRTALISAAVTGKIDVRNSQEVA